MATGLATIYEALHQDRQMHEFVEELHQTGAKEFWYRAIAVLQQFSIQSHLKGILLTHHPYILGSNTFYPVFFLCGRAVADSRAHGLRLGQPGQT